jgi:hypothetical protein
VKDWSEVAYPLSVLCLIYVRCFSLYPQCSDLFSDMRMREVIVSKGQCLCEGSGREGGRGGMP